MPNGADRSRIARALADAHRESEPAISRIIQVVAEEEDSTEEPVKLLEINPETSPSGIIPIAFGPNPPEYPFPSVIIEVTEAEFESIQSGRMHLPAGWRLGETLYPSAA
jgi:hypothetical protein